MHELANSYVVVPFIKAGIPVVYPDINIIPYGW